MTPPAHSHDFIGEFTTSYRELARGQSQFNVYEVRRGRGDGCCAPTATTGAAIPTLPPMGPTDRRDSMLHPQESPTGVTAPPCTSGCSILQRPASSPFPQVVNPRKKMKKKKYLNSGTVRAGGHRARCVAAVLLTLLSPQVTLLSFAVESDHTFLDYIRGG